MGSIPTPLEYLIIQTFLKVILRPVTCLRRAWNDFLDEK